MERPRARLRWAEGLAPVAFKIFTLRLLAPEAGLRMGTSPPESCWYGDTRRARVGNPTAVFLQSGFISFVAGSVILLLIFLFCYEPSYNKRAVAIADAGSEDSKILEKLKISADPPTSTKPDIDMLKIFGVDPESPAAERKTATLDFDPRAPRNDNILEELERNVAPPIDLQPLSGKNGNAGLWDASGAGGAPQPMPGAFNGMNLEEPEPKSYKPASLPATTLLPMPPVPTPHPHRLMVLGKPVIDDDPRSMLVVIPKRPPKPRSTWDSALSLFASLWRPARPAEQPRRPEACRDVAGITSTALCSRVGTRLLRQ